MKILGIEIDALSHEEALDHVQRFLDEPGYHRIATVNPEFLLLAQKDPIFRQALMDADLRIADGFGVALAGLLHGRCITRFPGADLMEAILKIANDRKLSIYLAIRADGLSSYEEIRTAILKKYPDIIISGVNIDITDCRLQIADSECTALQSEIKNLKSKIILCNFGIPHQETFLAKMDNAGLSLGIGVGGSFDYLTGKLRRAPQWMRTLGLEWLWRLILQPHRFRRIWNAAVIFPIKNIFLK